MTGTQDPRTRSRLWRAAAAVVGGALLLSAAAVYNRYPLLFYDAEMYVHPVAKMVRPPFYSWLLVPMHLFWSLWLVVFWQSMIVSHLVYRTARTTFPGLRGRHHLAIVAVLVLVSSVPWVTGFVMPDVFAAVLLLAIYLVTFRWSALTRAERVYLPVLLVTAMLVHSSHVPLACGLLVFLWGVKIVVRRTGLPVAMRTAPLAAGLAVAVAITLTYNAAAYRCISLSPAGYAHVLARLIEDGPAVAYLKQCRPPDRFALCRYTEELPMTINEFLWKPYSPFRKVGGFEGYAKEGSAIVLGTVTTYPLWTLQCMVVNMTRQLVWIDSRITYVPLESFEALADQLKAHFPGEYHAFTRARQNQDTLGLETFKWIHFAGLALATLLTLVLLFRWWRERAWLPMMLVLTLAVGSLLSTSMTAALSEPATRYLVRVAWLCPLVACLGVASVVIRKA
jgi:hypothetical protein